MSCRLFGAKPLSKPMLDYCQLEPREGTNLSEILIKIQILSFNKINLKTSSSKWRPFCPALLFKCSWVVQIELSQIAKFMGPKWGPPGSCRSHIGPMNLREPIRDSKHKQDSVIGDIVETDGCTKYLENLYFESKTILYKHLKLLPFSATVL